MKPLRLLALAAVLLGAANTSRAGFYAKATGLYSSSSDIKVDSASSFKTSLKSNAGLAAALGYKFSFLRAEAELQYFKTGTGDGSNSTGGTTSSGDLKQFNGFVNALADLPSFFGLAPYIGAGLGMAQVNLDNFNASQGGSKVVQFSDRKSVFGYQLMAGLQFHLFGQATLNAGYRFLKKDNIEMHDVVSNAQQSVKLGASNIFELGVAIGF